ncbi:AraC family transcriptional regulator [Telluria sp. B2]
MIESPSVDLAIRSYPAQPTADRHDFAQLVLPLDGEVRLAIDGREGRLDPLHGALVVPGAWHSQYSAVANRSLIVDIGRAAMTHDAFERLRERPFTPIGAAARKLVEYMGIMAARQAAPAVLAGWMPLLLDTLALDVPQPRSRLAALLARIEAEPGLAWSLEAMARCAGLSASRLHELFREELDTSPHAWLLQKRIELACRQLAGSGQAIAEVALRAGFADQSALTRAMRRHMDTTPAAYRRRSRENAGP